MDFSWTILIDFGIISFALLLATGIRSRFGFFQKFLIPNALTAGFLLLAFYNTLGPRLGRNFDALGEIVFHLFNIAFIAFALRKPDKEKRPGKPVAGMVVGILSQYAIQAFLGFGITMILIATILPDLFPSFGLLLPMGFALGPGKAFAIAKPWEALGFDGAGSVGLTFGAIGFLWASLGGFFLVNYGLKHGWLKKSHAKGLENRKSQTGILVNGKKLPVGSYLTTETEAIDTMSFNVAVVFAVYLITYLFLKLLTYLLSFIGPAGMELANSFWGITFIFGSLWAIIVRNFMEKTGSGHILESGTLTRFGSGAVDLVVATSIGAISIAIVIQYWVPILILSILGGVIALICIPWMCSRMFDEYQFHKTLIVYGCSTGTLHTGLVLLRVIDPDFDTPTISDYIGASAIVFFFAIPLILMIQLPVSAYTQNNPVFLWVTLGICSVYVVGIFFAYLLVAGKKRFEKKSRIWRPED